MIRHILAACLILTIYGCGSDSASVTVPGPESDALVPGAIGYVVVDRPFGGIVAVQLPTLRNIIVRPTGSYSGNDTPTIHMLSGPDHMGRIAYIEDHFFVEPETNRRHMLKTIHLDGTNDTTLFTRPGDAMWAESSAGHGEIGHHLSLAPIGGRVAFLSELKDLQMPSALLFKGSIEFWNIEDKSSTKTNLFAIDEGLSWFPDGKRLAYVKMIDPKGDTRRVDSADPIANSFIKWNWGQIPAVFIHDADNRTESFVHVGWKPIVSEDGSEMIIGDRDSNFYAMDIANGRTSPLTGPGKSWPIAMPDANTLLSLCAPTAGTDVTYASFYRPAGSGPSDLLSAKLTRTDSQAFQTVIPFIDRRNEISFGVGITANP